MNIDIVKLLINDPRIDMTVMHENEINYHQFALESGWSKDKADELLSKFYQK